MKSNIVNVKRIDYFTIIIMAYLDSCLHLILFIIKTACINNYKIKCNSKLPNF